MRAATIRGLSRSPTAGVFSEANEAFTPRSLPNLAAWFDALDTRTMLAGDGATITDGGTVALWRDKSGNSGVNALVLPAVSANYAYIPHDAGWGLSGTEIWDVDGYYNILAAPASTQCIWAKRLSTGNQRAVNCGINADGTIGFTWSSSGAVDAGTLTSTVAITFPFQGYIRATFNPNNGANSAVNFYTSTNGATWSALGVQRTAATSTVFASTATFEIGSFNSGTSQNLAAIVYRTRVYKGLRDSGGTLLADIDFSTAGTKLANLDSFVCTTGQTVTLNSSGATGARIAGERDWYQSDDTKKSVYVTKDTLLNDTNCSGSGTMSGLSPTGFTLTALATSFKIGRQNFRATNLGFPVSVGDVVTVSFNYVRNSGTASNYVNVVSGAYSEITAELARYPLAAGENTYTWNVTTADGNAFVIFGNVNGAADDYTISNLVVKCTSYRPFLHFDGTDDYYKTAAFSLPQPVTLYAVIEQTTWTSGDYLIDGSASDTLALIQTTTTPQINLSAGSSVAANTDLAVETKALVTIVSNGASSLVSINRLPATTGNAGAGVPNGLTLASKGTAGSYGNARYYEIAVYRAAHDQATRHRFALYAARKWGFAA